MVVDWIILLGLVTGSRLLARTIVERPAPGSIVSHGKEVVVVGAGDAGQLVIRELQKNRVLGSTPIGIVDDDPRKRNLRVQGVRVLGTTADLPRLLREHRPDELIIAIPSASGEQRRRIVEIARDEGVPVKTVPGLYELISDSLAGQIRPVEVEDVLGREPVDVDIAARRRVPRRRDGAHHRRGRLDRLGALPPDRARRTEADDPGRPGRDADVRDRA